MFEKYLGSFLPNLSPCETATLAILMLVIGLLGFAAGFVISSSLHRKLVMVTPDGKIEEIKHGYFDADLNVTTPGSRVMTMERARRIGATPKPAKKRLNTISE